MANTANSGELLHHINLNRVFRGRNVVPVDGRRNAFVATSGASLIDTRETRAAQVACPRACVSATLYMITRQIDNLPKADILTRFMYRRVAWVAVLSRGFRYIFSAPVNRETRVDIS